VAAAPVAGAVVLDMAREKQQSGGVRWKSRAGWERGASGEIWFLLDAKAGIRVAVDKRSTWPTIVALVGLWAVEVGGRWRGSVATRGERGDKATRALG
jgi:hypothetical protein